MKKIVTMGEIMLRLSTVGYEKLTQAERFDAVYGGGEANVAVSLASFGLEAAFVTKVPDNSIGQSAINAIRRYGVDTTNIVKGQGRLGLYFLEPGVSVRNSNVIYDRKGSAISLAKSEEFDFDRIFEGAGWFHMSGITPALSNEAFELSLAFLKEAKKRNVIISFDINYRSKLWTMEEASRALMVLAPYVDVCFGSRRDMELILGIAGTSEDEIFKNACEKYGFRYIITSKRDSIDATHNKYSAKVYCESNGEYAHSRVYDMDHMVDRVGGGDAMAAGMIYKLCQDMEDYRAAIEFAVAASALKHTVPGDYNIVSVQEVMSIIDSENGTAINR